MKTPNAQSRSVSSCVFSTYIVKVVRKENFCSCSNVLFFKIYDIYKMSSSNVLYVSGEHKLKKSLINYFCVMFLLFRKTVQVIDCAR